MYVSLLKVLRLPVSFKSCADEKEYCHIVLGVRNKNKWGAIGISRLPNLMYKPLRFETLADLVDEFLKCYDNYYHKIIQVNVGLPFPHDQISETPLQWKVLRLKFDQGSSWQAQREGFIQYSKDCSLIYEHFVHSGKMPDWCTADYKRGIIKKKARR